MVSTSKLPVFLACITFCTSRFDLRSPPLAVRVTLLQFLHSTFFYVRLCAFKVLELRIVGDMYTVAKFSSVTYLLYDYFLSNLTFVDLLLVLLLDWRTSKYLSMWICMLIMTQLPDVGSLMFHLFSQLTTCNVHFCYFNYLLSSCLMYFVKFFLTSLFNVAIFLCFAI